MKLCSPYIVPALCAAVLIVSPVRAAYLDLDDPGGVTPGSFTGILNGVSVLGVVTVGVGPAFHFETFFVPSPSLGKSTIDNTSPQHMYPGIYTPTESFTDRIGYESVASAPHTAHIHVTFGGVVVNPIIAVANVDLSYFDFISNIPNGMTGMSILSGNGGGGDGLALTGTIIHDLVPTTPDFTPDGAAPPIGGPRGAYGSIQIYGSFTALDFDIKNDDLLPGVSIDNATFTLVPEPGSALLACVGFAGLAGLRRRRA